jgi:hypothetical protein
MGLIVGGVAMIESAGRCPAANSRGRYGRRSSVWIYPRPTINPPPADFLLLQMRYPSLLRGWRWLWLGCVVLEQRRRRGCGPPHQRQFSEHSAEAVPQQLNLVPTTSVNYSSCGAHAWSKSSRSRLYAGSIEVRSRCC